MSSDGHGFIGRLTLDEGGCVNVSLPVQASRALLNHAPTTMTVRGKVFPYVHDDNLLELQINGRSVGYGLCGDFFVFVK